jgi:hypothetical protein
LTSLKALVSHCHDISNDNQQRLIKYNTIFPPAFTIFFSLSGPAFSTENLSHAASLGVPYATALNSFSNDVNMERLKSSNGATDVLQSFNRKRALSSSPYPDLLDVSTMIRHSPNSLYGSKTSHMSGSFGHLAAMTALNNTNASGTNGSIGSHMSISSLPTSLQHFLMSGDILPSLSGHYISPSNSMFSLAHHQAMMQVDASMQSLKSVSNINLFVKTTTFLFEDEMMCDIK